LSFVVPVSKGEIRREIWIGPAVGKYESKPEEQVVYRFSSRDAYFSKKGLERALEEW